MLPRIAGGPELAAKLTADTREKLLAAMGGLKERAKTLVELADGARFIVAERPLALDDNAASRALLRGLGFREVGTYEKHAKLDGVWRDVVIVERLLTDAPAG